MVFNSPCLTDKKELIHHEVKWFSIARPLRLELIELWFQFPGATLSGSQGLPSPEQTATVGLVVQKSVAGSSFPAASSTLLPFDVQFQGYEDQSA
ncbi:hypothetical protein Tco_1082743 [Tanacetum coccineum]|uniref:Uncharacterized protein n=1 Tax=Tanacetum coccineum TaxID=301880 RepID=A0ABQ5I1H7_9ASTR